jgi:type IV secretory pathway TrbD component
VNESQFARTIKDALDAGLGLSPEASARLKVARERALERHRAPARELALAGAGRAGAVVSGPSHFVTRILLPAAFLVAAAIGLQQWQEAQRAAHQLAQQVAEIEEIDSGLLTGDLPIKAYLDEDFQAWLKRTSE